jgi:predicted transcriptional regulator
VKSKEIALLKKVSEGMNNKNELRSYLKVQNWQFNYIIKELVKRDFLEQFEKKVELRRNAKTILFKEVSERYAVGKLLLDSNEIIYSFLMNPESVSSLVKKSLLSESTVYKSLRELESIGIVVKKDNLFSLKSSSAEPLYLFAAILNKELKDDAFFEESAEIIFRNSLTLLKRVPRQEQLTGDLTAYSLFSEYDLHYHPIYDYYVEQSDELDREHILIHSIVVAKKDQDINELIMSMLFYIKNKKNMDLLKIKKIARRMEVLDVWSDIEYYLRNYNLKQIKNKTLFTNKEEFEVKARLYNIKAAEYTLPIAYPNLFIEIDQKITEPVSVYIIGGENMRIKGLKNSTKDCDLVVDEDTAIELLSKALKEIGYTSIDEKKLSKDDVRVGAVKKFTYSEKSDIEIFYKNIGNKLSLTNGMKQRSVKLDLPGLSRLKLFQVSNEDIFLLKTVTSREGDLDDMKKIIESGNFDWSIVYKELEDQFEESRNYFSIVLDSIDELIQRTGIRPPFYKKLLRKVIDTNICNEVRRKKGLTLTSGVYLDELVDSMKGLDVSEKLIRNRVDFLQRKRMIRKINARNGIYLKLTSSYGIRIKDTISHKPLESWYIADYYSVVEYLHMIAKNLSLPESLTGESIRIAEQVSKDVSFNGNRPRNMAAAIINVAVKNYAIKRTQKQISLAANVSEPSIISISQKVRRNLERY